MAGKILQSTVIPVEEDDEPVNFDLVEPAKNHKPWTPKYITILCPLNNARSSRSASGLNGYDDDDDLYSIGELPGETGDPKEAIVYALSLRGIEVTPTSRFSVDEVLDYMVRAGRPVGWIPSSRFIHMICASRAFFEELCEKEEHVRPVRIGTVLYCDPEWDTYVIAYRIRRADEKAAERLAARKAYHPTSKGPLSRVRYPTGTREGFIPPVPTWLTQAQSDGLYTSTQIAKILDVSSKTIRNWTNAGYLEPARIVKMGTHGEVRLYKSLDSNDTVELLKRVGEGKREHFRKGIAQVQARAEEKARAKAEVEAERKVKGPYRLPELAVYLGYSYTYVKNLVTAGSIPYTKKGYVVIVSKADADEWRRRHIEHVSARGKSRQNP